MIAFNFIPNANQSGAVLTVLNGGRTDSVGKAYAIYTAGSLQRGLNIQDAVQANIQDYSGVVTITRKGARQHHRLPDYRNCLLPDYANNEDRSRA